MVYRGIAKTVLFAVLSILSVIVFATVLDQWAYIQPGLIVASLIGAAFLLNALAMLSRFRVVPALVNVALWFVVLAVVAMLS